MTPLSTAKKIPRPEGWVMALLIPAVGGVLYLTLTPQGPGSGGGLHPLCFGCGDAPLANVIRNVILFMPMGLLLGRWLGRSLPVLLAALLLSTGIETAQLFVPGRNPLLIDVLANGAGGWLGARLGVRLDGFLHPAEGRRKAFRIGSMMAAAGFLLFSGWALSIDPPTEALTVTYAPVGPPGSELDDGPYPLLDTRVHRALFDGEVMAWGPHSDSDGLSRRIDALFTGEEGESRLDLHFSQGMAPFERGQILFRVHSGQGGREAMGVFVRRNDLELSPPLRTSRLDLAGPVLRWPDALEGWMPTDTLTLSAMAGGDGRYCLELEGDRRCEPLPSIAEGWSLLLFPRVPGWGRSLLTFLWIAGLLAPGAFWSRGIGEAVRGGILPAGALLLVPFLFGSVGPAPLVAWLGVPAGIAAGLLLPKPAPRTWPRSDDRGASSTPVVPNR